MHRYILCILRMYVQRWTKRDGGSIDYIEAHSQKKTAIELYDFAILHTFPQCKW